MPTLTMHPETSEGQLAHHLRRFKAQPSASFITKLNAMNAAAATTIGAAAAVATATSVSWAAKTSVAGLSSVLTVVGGSKGAIVVLTLSLGVSVAATQRDADPRQAAPEVAHAMNPEPDPREPKTDTVSNVGRNAAPMNMALPSEVPPSTTEEPSPTQQVEAKPKQAPLRKSRHVSTLPDAQQKSYEETVDRWRSGLDKCQRKAREAGSRQVSGPAEVGLVIGKNGLAPVHSIELDSSSDLDPDLIECVKLEISRWQFVRRDELVELSFTLQFAP